MRSVPLWLKNMINYLLKNALLVTLYPAKIEQGDLRIADGKIVEKASHLAARPEEITVDLAGKILMPGMVCAHTHLYSALARGMSGPAEPPANFLEILEKLWWKLDRALDDESLYYSAVVGVLDALASGTTTIIDHHASPGYLAGSLKILKDVFETFGARGILCYEVTDRNGEHQRDLGIEENRWLLEHQSELVKGLVGAHAAFTLNDESLRLCAELAQTYDSGVHIHVAEGDCDVQTSAQTYGKNLMTRLRDDGVLNAKSLLAHGVHLSDSELEQAHDIGCWLIHNPRSNMNNAVGYAPITKFGRKAALGTDGITSNMFEEAKFMFFKAKDAGLPLNADECMRFLAGGQQIATELFGLPIGTLDAGAAADLIVLDYLSPTPLHEGNLSWHLIFGVTHAHVESVMVAGKFLIRERRFVEQDIATLYRNAQQAANRLWQRYKTI